MALNVGPDICILSRAGHYGNIIQYAVQTYLVSFWWTFNVTNWRLHQNEWIFMMPSTRSTIRRAIHSYISSHSIRERMFGESRIWTTRKKTNKDNETDHVVNSVGQMSTAPLYSPKVNNGEKTTTLYANFMRFIHSTSSHSKLMFRLSIFILDRISPISFRQIIIFTRTNHHFRGFILIIYTEIYAFCNMKHSNSFTDHH